MGPETNSFKLPNGMDFGRKENYLKVGSLKNITT